MPNSKLTRSLNMSSQGLNLKNRTRNRPIVGPIGPNWRRAGLRCFCFRQQHRSVFVFWRRRARVPTRKSSDTKALTVSKEPKDHVVVRETYMWNLAKTQATKQYPREQKPRPTLGAFWRLEFVCFSFKI